MVYDSILDRLLVFGGLPNNPAVDTVWALALSGSPTWEALPTVGGPEAAILIGSAGIFDPVRDRVLVFGGLGIAGVSDTCWTLDLTAPTLTWTPLSTVGTRPGGLVFCSAIYDSLGDRMIIFGGADASSAAKKDVWTLDLAETPSWTLQAPAGPLPAPRSGHGVSYDPVRRRMLVVDGWDGAHYLSDTWSLDLAGGMTWTLSPYGAFNVPARQYFAQGYDPDSDRVIVFGGYNGKALRDDFTLSANGLVVGPDSPARRYGPGANFDPVHDDMLVFGGVTWESPSYVYDNELYALHLGPRPQWRLVPTPLPRPQGRANSAQAFDPAGNRLIVFGGDNGAGRLADLWQLSLAGTPVWNNISAEDPSGPLQRNAAAAAFDPLRRRFLVFGGFDGAGTQRNDLWAYSLSDTMAWTQLSTGAGPPARYGTSMIYDPTGDRVIVFDGATSNSTFQSDLWAYSFGGGATGWASLSALGTPPSPRAGHVAVYDSVGQRMIVSGGYDLNYRNDAWALSLGAGTPTWTQLTPTGTLPDPRTVASAIYDPGFDRMIMFGGIVAGNAGTDETWELFWGDLSTPALVSLVDESVEPGIAHLTWFTPDGGGVAASVERTSEGDAWATVAQVVSDAAGRFTFEDRLTRGGLYGYRLVVGPARTPTEATWISVPGPATGLALALVRPNPSRGGPVLEFTLADASTAEIAVFDVRGRRVFRRDVTALGLGAHSLDLRELLPNRAGIYLAVLRQTGKSRSRKFALLP